LELYGELHKRATSNLVFSGQPMLARLVCLPRAPHPAATSGGFSFGKFRRDDQPSLRYGSAGQRCLVQKLESGVHLIRAAFACATVRNRWMRPA
jgi:hypothetical protein